MVCLTPISITRSLNSWFPVIFLPSFEQCVSLLQYVNEYIELTSPPSASPPRAPATSAILSDQTTPLHSAIGLSVRSAHLSSTPHKPSHRAPAPDFTPPKSGCTDQRRGNSPELHRGGSRERSQDRLAERESVSPSKLFADRPVRVIPPLLSQVISWVSCKVTPFDYQVFKSTNPN